MSYIRRLGVIFFCFKIWNFNIGFFLVFRKMNIFLAMKILWIFFLGHPKVGLVLAVFLCILGSFLKVNIQNQDTFGV